MNNEWRYVTKLNDAKSKVARKRNKRRNLLRRECNYVLPGGSAFHLLVTEVSNFIQLLRPHIHTQIWRYNTRGLRLQFNILQEKLP